MSAHPDVFIVSAARTALGSFQGALGSVAAPRLGAAAIAAAVERAQVSPSLLGELRTEVFMGNVLGAGVGQAPARQTAIYAGLPNSLPATTINKVCGSGLQSILLGARAIAAGETDVAVVGGMENMTLAPYLLPGARAGMRLGDQKIVDSLVHDGLWDPYGSVHMGNCAELCAREKKFSREEQDRYAAQSFRRATEAQKSGKFAAEIAPVMIPGKKGEATAFATDEGPSKANFEKMPQLKPVFDKAGTVTAANASTINDGAAALLLMSEAAVKRSGAIPLARIVSSGRHAQAPEWFTTAPVGAMKMASERAGWRMADVDLFEVNEAFAVVALAAARELEIPEEKLNVWGGAISLGHPIGASGARIVVTLLSALRDRGARRGMAGICIGGGEGLALAVERIG